MSQPKLIFKNIVGTQSSKMCVPDAFLTLLSVTKSGSLVSFYEGLSSSGRLVPNYNYNPLTLSNCTKFHEIIWSLSSANPLGTANVTLNDELNKLYEN